MLNEIKLYRKYSLCFDVFLDETLSAPKRRKHKEASVTGFSPFFPFFIILQQKEYKAFRKHLPYFKGNSKCFAWLQQLKSLFFNISIESVTLVHAQLQK